MNDYIAEKLKEIIQSRFKLDFSRVKDEDYDTSFFNPVFGFSASDMLYLFFDVEKAFGIKIPEADIEADAFSSFNSITGVIERQLKHK